MVIAVVCAQTVSLDQTDVRILMSVKMKRVLVALGAQGAAQFVARTFE